MLGVAVDFTTMDLSIFDAFPNAIISGVWQLGTCQHGTIVGNEFSAISDIDVVVDEGNSSDINNTPEALNSDILIYAHPEQLPTLNTARLVSNYMLYNTEEDAYYMIVDAGIGKNQHTGKIEHVELRLVQTEVADA